MTPSSLRTVFPGPGASALVLLAASVLLSGPLSAQSPHGDSMTGQVVEGEDFVVYDGEGRARSFAHILQALDDTDAVLVGESHDDVVGHGVEAQLLVRAAQRFGAVGDDDPERPVVLSLEMFERDVQYILDEYLEGYITEDQFLESTRPWDWYRTDYRPLVEFARAHGLPVVAANAPRRYINRVTRLGPGSLEELPEEARRHLPALPYPGPSQAYEEQWNAVMRAMLDEAMAGDGDEAVPEASEATEDPSDEPDREEHEVVPHDPGSMPEPGADGATPPPAHGMGFALDAQALWDASMGEAVARALDRDPGALVVHYAGSFHVARGTGIPERLPEYRPGTRVLTVVMRPVDDVHAWDEEEEGLGDFVILTREKERPSPHGVLR